mgnify:CR=1 FL=1
MNLYLLFSTTVSLSVALVLEYCVSSFSLFSKCIPLSLSCLSCVIVVLRVIFVFLLLSVSQSLSSMFCFSVLLSLFLYFVFLYVFLVLCHVIFVPTPFSLAVE